MKNQNILQFAQDVVIEEIRKGNLIKTKDILALVPKMIDLVFIDREKLRTSINQCLSSSNPLNAVLKLFGVQLIKTDLTIDNLVQLSSDPNDDLDSSSDDSYAKRWLALNPEEYVVLVEEIAQKLFELETRAGLEYDEEKKRGDDLFGKFEALLKEFKTLKQCSEINEKMVAERIQYILSQDYKNTESVNEQLMELLEDLSIEVYWNSTDAHFPDAAMFTEYTVDDEAIVCTKPCLVRNGSIYVKGMRFIKKV